MQYLLLRLEGFPYGTTLDINMGYYHIEISAESKELCTIVTQWYKYEYQRLPMGLCNRPNIFQEKIFEHFAGLDTIRVYFDEILHVTKGSWKEHINALKEMFVRLHKAGPRSTVASHASDPTNLNTWFITSLVTVLCTYQRKLRSFKPSQSERLEKIAPVHWYYQLLSWHVAKSL